MAQGVDHARLLAAPAGGTRVGNASTSETIISNIALYHLIRRAALFVPGFLGLTIRISGETGGTGSTEGNGGNEGSE